MRAHPHFISTSLICVGLAVSACSSPASVNPDLEGVKSFDQTLAILGMKSCADAEGKFDLSPIAISSVPVELGSEDAVAAALPDGVTFTGGWHLTSAEADFGGLSGLEVLPSGDLLVVSDKGLFFEIGMMDGAPDGRGAMLPMRGPRGETITGKARGDAEGLALVDGIAFVSFERQHRILAFDLGQCGSGACGAWFTRLPDAVFGAKIGSNEGAEGLDYTQMHGLQAGYETTADNIAPLVTFGPTGGQSGDIASVKVEAGFKLVGLSNGTELLRSYVPETGNRNHIRLSDGNNFQLAPPLATDNFEGIVDIANPNGGRTLYIVSDDNFSARQRTLLYRFDLAP